MDGISGDAGGRSKWVASGARRHPVPCLFSAGGVCTGLCCRSPWLLRLRGVHPVSAVIAAIFVLWLVGQAKRAGARRLASVVLTLLGFQFALGLADILLLAPVWMQILHLLGADLYWVALVTLAAVVIWPARSSAPREQITQASNPQPSLPVA